MPYSGIFVKEFEKKKLFALLKSAPSNLPISKTSRKKKKYLNLGPKMLDLGIFGLEFEKYIVILEISTLQFV